jgi:DNA-binding NarL/FixJ family response regulator
MIVDHTPCDCCGRMHPLKLTDRALVLLLAQDLTNAEIAYAQGFALQTIKHRVTLLIRDWNVGSRTGVVLHALKHGFITVDDLLPSQ